MLKKFSCFNSLIKPLATYFKASSHFSLLLKTLSYILLTISQYFFLRDCSLQLTKAVIIFFLFILSIHLIYFSNKD